MFKNFIFFIIFVILLSIISISKSEENSSNNTDHLNETKIDSIDEDPFKNYNFANIMTLGDSNYTEEIKKYDSLYLLVYAPWCGHCHEFIPIYIETANYCKEYIPSLKFAKIDGSKNQNASSELAVEGFPSIYFIYKGALHPYVGIRSKDGLIYFMKRKMSGDIFTITRLDELNDIKKLYNSSLILLSTVKDSTSNIYKSFELFSKDAIYVDFVSCLSDECYKKYGEDIILLKDFDEKENRYFANYGRLDQAKNESVKNFTAMYGIEAGGSATQLNINLAFEYEKLTIYYIRNSSIPEHTKYDHIFKELGKQLRGDNILTFVCSPDGNEIQQVIYKAFSVTPDEMPGIFYYDPYSKDPTNQIIKLYSIRHVDLKKLNINYIKNFIKDINDGKIKRDLFSEMPSEKKYINGMKYVIGKTFDKDVIEEKNNVFLGLIEGYGGETETKFLEILGNLTIKYQDDAGKKIKFNIMNINNNEPRDINANEYDFPRAYLYTNAMDKKERFRLTPKNMSELNFDEFEEFLIEKLNWNNKDHDIKNKDKKDKGEKEKSEDL